MSSPPSLQLPEPQFRETLKPADPDRIGSLVLATGVFSDEEIEMAATLARTTLDGTEVYSWLLAEDAGDLLGYTCYLQVPLASVSFDLYWIAVHPSRQRTGLARLLVERTAGIARAAGGIALYAETSGTPPYAAARDFYQRVGFEEAGHFPDFYRRGDAKVIYRLWL